MRQNKAYFKFSTFPVCTCVMLWTKKDIISEPKSIWSTSSPKKGMKNVEKAKSNGISAKKFTVSKKACSEIYAIGQMCAIEGSK